MLTFRILAVHHRIELCNIKIIFGSNIYDNLNGKYERKISTR